MRFILTCLQSPCTRENLKTVPETALRQSIGNNLSLRCLLSSSYTYQNYTINWKHYLVAIQGQIIQGTSWFFVPIVVRWTKFGGKICEQHERDMGNSSESKILKGWWCIYCRNIHKRSNFSSEGPLHFPLTKGFCSKTLDLFYKNFDSTPTL